MDEPAGRGGARRLQHAGGPVSIDGQELAQVSRADPTGDVVDDVRAGAPFYKRGPSGEIARDHANTLPPEGAGPVGRPHETGNLVAARPERCDEMGAYEPRPAGHERLHNVLSRMRYVL